MRSWLAKSAMDADVRKIADENRAPDLSTAQDFYPNCWQCSKAAKRDIKVVAYGVADCGKLPGTTGDYYTDFEASCNHGGPTRETQVIRIEGLRWDDLPKDGFSGDTIAILAAIKKLPFFHTGGSPVIPRSVFRNFIGSWRNL